MEKLSTNRMKAFSSFVEPFSIEVLQDYNHRSTVLSMEREILDFLHNPCQIDTKRLQHYGLWYTVVGNGGDESGEIIIAKKPTPTVCTFSLANIPVLIPENSKLKQKVEDYVEVGMSSGAATQTEANAVGGRAKVVVKTRPCEMAAKHSGSGEVETEANAAALSFGSHIVLFNLMEKLSTNRMKAFSAFVEPFLIEVLQDCNHRSTVLSMEHEILDFLHNPCQIEFIFPPLSPFLHCVTQKVLQHYGLRYTVVGNGGDESGEIIIAKKPTPTVCTFSLANIPVLNPENSKLKQKDCNHCSTVLSMEREILDFLHSPCQIEFIFPPLSPFLHCVAQKVLQHYGLRYTVVGNGGDESGEIIIAKKSTPTVCTFSLANIPVLNPENSKLKQKF
ncbi:hypothetical protein V2J09_014423 [Rumex salicifolius]